MKTSNLGAWPTITSHLGYAFATRSSPYLVGLLLHLFLTFIFFSFRFFYQAEVHGTLFIPRPPDTVTIVSVRIDLLIIYIIAQIYYILEGKVYDYIPVIILQILLLWIFTRQLFKIEIVHLHPSDRNQPQ